MYIEKMRAGDLPVLFEKISEVIDQVYTMEMIDSLVSQWPSGCFVLRSESSIAGFLLSKKDEDGFAQIGVFGLEEEHRRKGFGALLMNKLFDQCIMENIPAVQLEVAVDNLEARRFYERLGFIQNDLLKHFYPDGRNAYSFIKFL